MGVDFMRYRPFNNYLFSGMSRRKGFLLVGSMAWEELGPQAPSTPLRPFFGVVPLPFTDPPPILI